MPIVVLASHAVVALPEVLEPVAELAKFPGEFFDALPQLLELVGVEPLPVCLLGRQHVEVRQQVLVGFIGLAHPGLDAGVDRTGLPPADMGHRRNRRRGSPG